jgi:hypothetical protein
MVSVPHPPPAPLDELEDAPLEALAEAPDELAEALAELAPTVVVDVEVLVVAPPAPDVVPPLSEGTTVPPQAPRARIASKKEGRGMGATYHGHRGADVP